MSTYDAGLLCATRVAPYFTTLLRSLRQRESTKLPTMAVDKFSRLYYNPDFVSKMTMLETASVVMHEGLHIFLQHFKRSDILLAEFLAAAPKTQHAGYYKLWNIAADFEINVMVNGIMSGRTEFKLPENAMLPSKHGYADNLTAEQYFHLLLQDNPPSQDDSDGDSDSDGDGNEHGSGAGNKPGSWEEDSDGSGGGSSSVEQEIVRRSAAEAINEHVAKNPGSVPGGLVRIAEELTRPTLIPWQQVIRAKVSTAMRRIVGSAEPTYRLLHRKTWSRSDAMGTFMPSPTHENSVPRILCAIDTSGSMSPSDLGEAVSAVREVIKAAGGIVSFISVDAVATKPIDIDKVRNIQLAGGGGTDMGIAYRVGADGKYDVTICITDGYTPWPEQPFNKAPKMQAIAVLTAHGAPSEGVPSWITTVRVGGERK